MNILSVFKAIGSAILKALRFAESRGLTDDLLDVALRLVTDAQIKFEDTEDRREFVVSRLQGKYVSESLARLATELAVQAYKKKVGG